MATTSTTLKAIITGSYAGAVRAFEDTAAASEHAGTRMGDAMEKSSSRIGKAFQGIGSFAGNWLGLPVQEPLNKLGEKFGDVESKGKSSFQTLSNVGGASLLGLGAAALAVGGDSIRLAENFDQTTGRIASSAGISQAAAKKIGDAFLSTAGQTTFSGQEIASAFAGVAGQLGATEGHALNSSQALQVMRGAMDLAEASGTSLTDATSGLSQVMQAYGLKTQDAASASDVLFNVSQLTHQPVAGLSELLSRLKGRLGDVAPSLQDVGTLMAFPQIASQGSRGAMIVNTAMTTLLGNSKTTQAELSSLGVNVYDASGKFIGMGGVISQLQPKLAGMSQEQQNAALKTLFGSSAAQLMGQVIAGGLPAYDSARQKVTKLGTAHDGAEKATSNLKGSVEKLKSAGEDLGVKLGEALIPKVTMLAQDVEHSITWFEKHKTVAEALAGVLGGVVAIAIGAFAINMGVKLVQSITSAGKAIGKLVTETIPKLIGGMAETETAEEGLAATSEETGSASALALGPIGIALMALVLVGTYVVTHWKAISQDLAKVWADVKHDVGVAFDWVKAHLSIIIPIIVGILTGGIGLIPALIATHWHTVEHDAEAIWGDIERFFAGVPGDIERPFERLGADMEHIGADALHGLERGADAAFGDLEAVFIGIPVKMLGWVASAGTWLYDAGRNVIEGLIHGIEAEGDNLLHSIEQTVTSHLPGFVKDALGIHSPSTVFAEIGRNMMQGLAFGIVEGGSSVTGAMTGIVGQLSSAGVSLPVQVAAGGSAPAGPASGGPGRPGGWGAGGESPGRPGGGVTQNVNVYAQTNASASDIAAKTGWALRTLTP